MTSNRLPNAPPIMLPTLTPEGMTTEWMNSNMTSTRLPNETTETIKTVTSTAATTLRKLLSTTTLTPEEMTTEWTFLDVNEAAWLTMFGVLIVVILIVLVIICVCCTCCKAVEDAEKAKKADEKRKEKRQLDAIQKATAAAVAAQSAKDGKRGAAPAAAPRAGAAAAPKVVEIKTDTVIERETKVLPDGRQISTVKVSQSRTSNETSKKSHKHRHHHKNGASQVQLPISRREKQQQTVVQIDPPLVAVTPPPVYTPIFPPVNFGPALQPGKSNVNFVTDKYKCIPFFQVPLNNSHHLNNNEFALISADSSPCSLSLAALSLS